MRINDGYPYITITASISGNTLTVYSVANGPLVVPSSTTTNFVSSGDGSLDTSAFDTTPLGGSSSSGVTVISPSIYGAMVGGLNVPANTFITQQLSGYPGGPGIYVINTSVTNLPTQTMLAAPWTLDVSETILAQYANSPSMLALVNNINQCLDPSANLFNFYNQVWNVLSATGYGLDVWGRIVGVKRVVNIPAGTSGYFFFNESGVGTPFGPGGSSPLFDGSHGTLYRLADAPYRTLILTKALANISNCSAKALNTLLQNLFGSGSCYVSDLGNMQMQITFSTLSSFNYYLLLNSKVLPRPAGVMAYVYSGYTPGVTFAFRESGQGTPFGYGVLFNGRYGQAQF